MNGLRAVVGGLLLVVAERTPAQGGIEHPTVIPLFVAEPGLRDKAGRLSDNLRQMHAPAARRARRVSIRDEIFVLGRVVPGTVLEVYAFDDALIRARVDRVAVDVNGTLMIRGRVEGEEGGVLLLSVSGRRVLGSIELPGTARKFAIRHVAALGVHIVEDVDRALEDVLEDAPSPLPSSSSEGEPPTALSDSGTNTIVDVMIVYTPAARSWADSYNSGIHHVIAQAMQWAQEAADNSNVAITFNLVHSAEVDYTESDNSSTDLYRLQQTSDGYVDQVHAWRNTWGADLVSMFTRVEDVGGIAYLLTSTNGQPAWAFSITRVQQAASGYTHVHEMGHNMGCHHRKDQAVSPGPGLFGYSAGWRWIGTNSTRYCSVMSYREPWDGQTVYQVGHFSSPLIQYMGAATGDAVDGDNARTLREIKTVIAGYRPSITRIVRLAGDMQFGSVNVGQTAQRTLSIYNDGNTTLTVSAISYPGAFSGAWNGTIGSGRSTNITVTFTPTSAAYYCGSLTVQSDATSGTNTRTVVGTGLSPNAFYLFITNPPGPVTVPYGTASRSVQGLASTSVIGYLHWTNSLTGETGAVPAVESWSLGPVALGVGTNGIAVRGTNQPAGPVVATDSATNAVYGDGWQTGDDGGDGFAGWTLNQYGVHAGHFRATTAGNPNLNIGSVAWGLWANSGATAEAVRFFDAPLIPSDTFLVKFENNWIETDRSVGFALQNSAGEYLFEFMFIGGLATYTINDQVNGRSTGIGWTDAGLNLAFDLTGPDTYRLRTGGTTLTGVLKARTDMVIRQFRAWNYSAGAGQNYDFFLTDLSVTNTPAAGVSTSSTTWIVREKAQPPFIAKHPESKSAFAGESVALSISATGEPPLFYQWWRGDADRWNATNAVFILSPITLPDAGMYHCVVSNIAGVATSQSAAVDVSLLEIHTGLLRVGAEGNILAWPSLADRVFDLYWSTNLHEPQGGFVPLATNLPARPPLNVYTDTLHQAEERSYYRIRSRKAE